MVLGQGAKIPKIGNFSHVFKEVFTFHCEKERVGIRCTKLGTGKLRVYFIIPCLFREDKRMSVSKFAIYEKIIEMFSGLIFTLYISSFENSRILKPTANAIFLSTEPGVEATASVSGSSI